ncbi:hypothetical protein [Microvirga massiliensis]|uniref:hypothetical protein n=1 Tax=Microvirga massiliensis TaxID=1033741 RepID=UPI00062BB1F6|nr:hypothetical protein [Microvirga massiliensis]
MGKIGSAPTNAGGNGTQNHYDGTLFGPPPVIQPSDLLPGDVLLYRPRAPNTFQRLISKFTDSPYTHAAICLGDNRVAESLVKTGVTTNLLDQSLGGSQCVGVLRSQLGFGGNRPAKLNEFVDAVLKNEKFYDAIGAIALPSRSKNYFGNQLEFIRMNYGKVTTDDEFAKHSFFCSAFVVACYSVVGVIGETAQAAYQPDCFSPGRLCKDPTFGWLLGYLVPDGGSVPPDDPLDVAAMKWRDATDM